MEDKKKCENGNTTQGIAVFKLNNARSLDWSRLYLTENRATGNSIERTSDNGFIIADTAWTGKDEDFCLIKIDPQGNLQWSKFWGGSYRDYGKHAIQTEDGGYALTGLFIDSINGWHAALVKTDSYGNY
jgi:hypothetical protein